MVEEAHARAAVAFQVYGQTLAVLITFKYLLSFPEYVWSKLVSGGQTYKESSDESGEVLQDFGSGGGRRPDLWNIFTRWSFLRIRRTLRGFYHRVDICI